MVGHGFKTLRFINGWANKNIAGEATPRYEGLGACIYTIRQAFQIVQSGVNSVSHAPGLLYELSDKPDFSKYPEKDQLLQDVFNKSKGEQCEFWSTILFTVMIDVRITIWKLQKKLPKKTMTQGDCAGTDSIKLPTEIKITNIHNESWVLCQGVNSQIWGFENCNY